MSYYADPHSESFANYFCLEADEQDFDSWLYGFVKDLSRPTAFVYAVKVASGIKIGSAGTGDKTAPEKQLSARFTNYRSISRMEVVGLRACNRYRTKDLEVKIHKDLANFKVKGIGRELFVDCKEVHDYLLDLMWTDWHDMELGLNAQSRQFKQMQNAMEEGIGDVFTAISEYGVNWEDGIDPSLDFPVTGWFSPVFSWQDWLDLRKEIALCNVLNCSELHDSLYEVASEMNLLAEDFGEKETDWILPLLLEALLPASTTRNPSLRAKFDRWLVESDSSEFMPWWDGALERAGCTVRAVEGS